MSQVNVANQAVSFLLSVALGAAIGLFYCFFCALRKRGYNRPWQVAVQDIIFWAVVLIITFCFFLLRCQGQIRGFVYLGELVGFGLFRLLLSRFTSKFFLALFSAVGLVLHPFLWIFRWLSKAFGHLWLRISYLGRKTFKKIGKWLKKVLKAERKVLYNNRESGT